MLNLAIPIPNVPGKQDFEIEMTMNGQRQKLHYRVEVFEWAECEIVSENRVDCIKDLVKGYSDEWEIYHIGAPSRNFIPLTFIKKGDWVRQSNWLWGTSESSNHLGLD